MRAFIGPIGDDIPAVIFIVMGLTVFFSAIYFVYSGWTQRQEGFQYAQAVAELSRIFTKDQMVDCQKFLETDTYKEGMERAKALGVEVSVEIKNIEESFSCDGSLLVYPVVCKDGSIEKMGICVMR